METNNSEKNIESKSKSNFFTKLLPFLDKYFYKIFNESHLLYTIIFFLAALIISLLSLIPIPSVGNLVLFLSTTFSLSFVLLMFIGLIPQMEQYLFSSEKKFGMKKIVGFVITYLISFIIVLLYFLLGSSSSSIVPIEFLGWDILLPALFVIIFFGWNLTQIFFLRSGIEDLSEKAEEKIISPNKSLQQKENLSLIFLVIALATPILLQIATLAGFISYFQGGSAIVADPLAWFILVNIIVFLIIGLTSWRQISLYIQSKNNNESNIFSSVFYLFIWLYLWYRVFSFLNAFRSQAQAAADIFTAIMDILLMVFTAILVLRGLGGKVWGLKIFQENNTPFFLYAFTMLYIEGQIIMITGGGNLVGIFSNRDQINLVNNFLIIVITIGFYIWYSSYILQRKGYITKSLLTQEEVVEILLEYREYLEKQSNVDVDKVSVEDLKNFVTRQGIEWKEKVKNSNHVEISTETIENNTEASSETEEDL